ncbi:hypothetical protein [Herbaspirillum rubrisubalbicans]|nr:hypothetical protein [Herbaspirillum rubrisubalbicans]
MINTTHPKRRTGRAAVDRKEFGSSIHPRAWKVFLIEVKFS